MFFTICTVQTVKNMLSCVFFAQIYNLNIVFFYNFALHKKNDIRVISEKLESFIIILKLTNAHITTYKVNYITTYKVN